MRLAQFIDENGKRALAVTARGESRLVKGARTTLDLARQAIAEGVSLRKLIADRGVGKPVDLARALKERRVLTPIDHKDPAHVIVTGTGLTHLGSAEGRDKMHRDLADPAKLTDSMRMFKLGLEGGRPAGAKPARSRNGSIKATAQPWPRPEGDLPSPAFALDGGEEPEIVGIYLIDDAGAPVRVGFALGNEFSDHVTERQNYLWLAHSKLRPASVGPELLVGDLPADVKGRVAHPAGQGSHLGEAVPVRRAKHGAFDRQSRGASFQIWPVSAPGRRPCPFLRHGDAVVQRRREDAEGRRVRDRVRTPSACRCAIGSPRKNRRKRGCGRFRAVRFFIYPGGQGRDMGRASGQSSPRLANARADGATREFGPQSSSPARWRAWAARNSLWAASMFFSEDMSAGRGWIAVVAVMLGRNHPLRASLACVLFGTPAVSVRLRRAHARADGR